MASKLFSFLKSVMNSFHLDLYPNSPLAILSLRNSLKLILFFLSLSLFSLFCSSSSFFSASKMYSRKVLIRS